jgi:hypothetical protein
MITITGSASPAVSSKLTLAVLRAACTKNLTLWLQATQGRTGKATTVEGTRYRADDMVLGSKRAENTYCSLLYLNGRERNGDGKAGAFLRLPEMVSDNNYT